MWKSFLIAFCLMLVIEGLIPALAPGTWRQAVARLVQMDDKILRIIGLASMITGAGFLYVLST